MLEFDVLGPLRVRLDGVDVPLPSGRQRLLLAVLLVHAGRPVPVSTLVDEIWGEDPPATVNAALQVHVSALRKLVGDRLRWTPGGYTLDVADQAIDARRFEAAVTPALSGRTPAEGRHAAVVEELRAADRLWRGPPFSGTPDSPALAAERHRLEELRLRALEHRLTAELALGRHHGVAAEVARLVAEYPARERLTGILMLALYRAGRPAEARAAYRDAVRALRAELGVAPGGDLTALAEAIDRQDPTLDLSPPSLPVPPTRFVGRRAELDQLGEVLGTTRLLTLTGPAGVGKTRLAVQLCREQLAGYPDGLTFVDLSALTGPAELLPRVADALDAGEGGSDTPLPDAVVARLYGGRRLLVLDNCEHLLAACADLAATLLGRCPGLRVLATSRARLGVAGETVWPVSGLSVDGAAGSDALRLLTARAQDVRRGFWLDARDAEVARALCARLDGLPLAIEMVAAQLGTMSIAEVARHLAGRIDLPAGAAAPRHRTLRAAVDWGHDLLTESERVVFRRLAVFAGGFTLEAAERVVADPVGGPVGDAGGADGERVRSEAVAAAVLRLVESSFLTASIGPGDAPTRYAMLQTLHDYAEERLAAAPDAGPTRRRHAEWCRDLAVRSAGFGGDLHGEHLQRLRTEQDNLRGALRWCLTPHGDAETALAIASSLWWFWWLTGQLAEGRQWLERALAATAGQPPARRASALRAVAALARSGHDLDAARRWGEEALAAARQVGNPEGIARALNGLCMTANAQNDLAVSLRYGTESRRQAELAGDERGVAVAANNVGVTLRCLGRIDESADLFEEARTRFAALHDRRGEAAALYNLAIVARRRGRLADSRALCLHSLRLYHELELHEGETDVAEAIACVEVAEGRPEPALRLLRAAQAARRELGALVFTPDEIADRDAALASATSALGQAADSVPTVPLSDVVADLLSRAPAQVTDSPSSEPAHRQVR